MIIKFKNADDVIDQDNQITIQNHFNGISNRIEILELSDEDSMEIDLIDINNLLTTDYHGDDSNNLIDTSSGKDTIYGYDGNDTINANAGDDIIIGGKGADNLRGGEGDDIYIYNEEDGKDTILESGSNSWTYINTDHGKDIIRLTDESLTKDNIIFTTQGGDLIIKFKDSEGNIDLDNQITIQRQFYGVNNRVEELILADDTRIDLSKGLTLTGTDFGDYISSTNYDDQIIGGKGDDYLYGGLGDDIYIYNKGDGKDIIYDYNNSYIANNDVIKLTDSNITIDDLVFIRSGYDNNNLIIRFKDSQTGEIDLENEINIDYHFYGNENQIEKLQLNGQLIDLATDNFSMIDMNDEGQYLESKLYHQDQSEHLNSINNNIIIGGDEDNILESNGNNNYLIGKSGDDIYKIANITNTKTIKDIIIDKDNNYQNNNDIIEILDQDITEEDLTFIATGDYYEDLLIKFNNNEVTIKNQFSYNISNQIEKLQLQNEISIDLTNNLDIHINGTEDGDYIYRDCRKSNSINI